MENNNSVSLRTTKSRNIKILASIICFISVVSILLIYNFNNIGNFECDESDCVKIYGNVKEVVYIRYSELTSTKFQKEEIDDFYVVNSFHTEYRVDIIGVQVWDILDTLGIFYQNTTKLRFEAIDGYKSPSVPISLLKDFPDSVLLITHEDGKLIKDKTSGGDGPIISAVSYNKTYNNQEVLDIFQDELDSDFVYNSAYKVKWLSAIYVI